MLSGTETISAAEKIQKVGIYRASKKTKPSEKAFVSPLKKWAPNYSISS